MDQEHISFGEARIRLGWSSRKLVRAVAAHGIKTYIDGTDGRKRLIAAADLERLKGPAVRPAIKYPVDVRE